MNCFRAFDFGDVFGSALYFAKGENGLQKNKCCLILTFYLVTCLGAGFILATYLGVHFILVMCMDFKKNKCYL